MATEKLDIYNGALIHCGARTLGSLTEENDRRRYLDEVWDDGGVESCLERGQWHFATRASKLSYDAAIEPAWGYNRAFTKPDDWVLTVAVCSDEYFQQPLLQYTDEAGVLYASLPDIYVKYVSDDTAYGFNYALWPHQFTEYVKAYMAWRVCRKLNQDEAVRKELEDIMVKQLREAKNNNMIALPTKFPAQGGWNNARFGHGSRGRDRGNSGSLIG